MTDETIETATILRHFVDLITGRKLPTPSDISSVDMRNIIHFATKYECQLALGTLLHALRSSQISSIKQAVT